MFETGFSFEFEPPLGWREFEKSGRLVFHGPAEEELILSGWTLTGSGTAEDTSRVRSQLVANAIASMEHALELPDVEVTIPLHEERTNAGLRRWTVEAVTEDSRTQFFQSAIEGEHGVLLVTLEAPASPHLSAMFNSFASKVRASASKATS